jgi:NitT/TauT family transport system substrate-binding protein
MRRSHHIFAPVVTAVLVFAVLSSCNRGSEAAAQATARGRGEGSAADTEQIASGLLSLKVAFLPVLDSLPYHIAVQDGLFEDAGVTVEGITVASSVERDQLLQAGQIDGMLNEILTTALFNREQIGAVTVRTIRMPTPGGPIFRILAPPGSDISVPADLAGVRIAGAVNSIIEYITDRIMTDSGVPGDQVNVVSVPAIPERFQLLMRGEVDAAVLPDPLAQAAMEAGAVLVADDADFPQYSLTALTFGADALAQKETAVSRFLSAWDRATEMLNANPDAYRTLFLEQVNVPESVQDTYVIPPFAPRSIPTEAQWDDVTSWLVQKGYLETAPAYADSVVAVQ